MDQKRKAMFAIMVDEAMLDILKEECDSLATCEHPDPAVRALGEQMLKAVHHTAKKLGFKYEHS